MSTPVTRGELREELALLEQKIEQKFDQKLELWGGALLARITESDQRAKESEQRLLARATESEQRLLARATESEQRLLTEIARHIRAANEAMIAQLSVIDEKYADLPRRVRRLETKVFVAKRR
jgi:cell division septum initiation protein DivIVA